ncbi:MAG: hypothetical protein E2O75_00065 [Chloroflexi bacterium]|nr:MAG: hypothetical protein E2O75_00065 [Chloroflexota bacterium]
MNWDAIGAVGEMVGAIAVLATLGYLVLQIRQNTAQSRASSHHAISESLNQINILFGQSTEVSALWVQGLENRSQLSEEQRWQFDSILRAYFHVCETMYFQAGVGTGDRGIVVAEERGMALILAAPGGHEWWIENPFGFSSEFREYIEKLVGSS